MSLEAGDRSSLSRIAKAAIVAVLVLLGFGLRAYGLDAAGLSEDEVNKVEAARAYLHGDFSENLEHPMLMKLQIAACLLATDAWNAKFGGVATIPEETPVRLPNVVFGALTAVVIFLLGETLFGTWVGLLAAAMWATGISAITINRIAKEDTLLVFFFLSCFYFYERAKQIGANHIPRQWKLFGLAGASLGLMLASKYFPHYWGLLFLFYHFLGRNEANQPLTKRDYLAFYGAFAACFLIFNPTVVLPSTWHYFVTYTNEQTLTHHGYVLMGKIYPNNISATPGGLPVYFYPLLLALKTPVPILAAFAIGLGVAIKRHSERGYFFLLFMFALWIVPYSIFAAKWLRYILSLLPILYFIAAVGVVESVRFLASRFAFARPAVALSAAAAVLVVVVGSLASAVASAPFYSLYLNAFGMGRTGYYFPHDEFYDVGLREAIQAICQQAPPGAVIYGEAPPVFRYYMHRYGRDDLRFHQLSEAVQREGVEPPEYVVVQDGRRFFENEAYIDALESNRRPDETVRVRGVDAARVYRMNAGTEIIRAR